MKRSVVASRLVAAASMVMLATLPMKAGAAGVYENATAEPAFLLSARRVTLSADLDFSRNDPVEASVYRVGATFPLRSAFKVGVEQTFASVSDTSSIQSGIGDLYVRASARTWGSTKRALYLLGYLVTGTTKQEFFPYSSKSLDLSASLAYADSLGRMTVYATAGRTWVHREDVDRPVDTRHSDCWRGSAGASFALNRRLSAQGGTLAEYTVDHAERWIWYGGAAMAATAAIVVRANLQFEVGEPAQRVSDWAASAGFTVRF